MKYVTTLILAGALPLSARAQFAAVPTDFAGLVGLFLEFISLLIVFVFALTFIVLIWGIVKAWILNSGDEDEVTKGKHIALTGVIALVIMSGIWGILALLRSSFFGI